jgi:hypothetical protein
VVLRAKEGLIGALLLCNQGVNLLNFSEHLRVLLVVPGSQLRIAAVGIGLRLGSGAGGLRGEGGIADLSCRVVMGERGRAMRGWDARVGFIGSGRDSVTLAGTWGLGYRCVDYPNGQLCSGLHSLN